MEGTDTATRPTRKPRATDARPPHMRSAVTNGKRLFVEGDGNSAWSRRYRDLVAAHASDLGGADTLTEAQASLVRRASAIECELEQMEGNLSKGEAVDLDCFTRAASHLRRILETLGLERRQRDVTPDLQSYLKTAGGAPRNRPGEALDASSTSAGHDAAPGAGGLTSGHDAAAEQGRH